MSRINIEFMNDDYFSCTFHDEIGRKCKIYFVNENDLYIVAKLLDENNIKYEIKNDNHFFVITVLNKWISAYSDNYKVRKDIRLKSCSLNKEISSILFY